MENKLDITLECPKCKSSVDIKTKKTGEVLISWSVPVDNHHIQELLVDKVQEIILNTRTGEAITIKIHSNK